jgi:hypothetical protein
VQSFSATPPRTRRQPRGFVRHCAPAALRSGSTGASFAAAMRGTSRSAGRSRPVCRSSRSSRTPRTSAVRAISDSNGSWRLIAVTSWMRTSRFCCLSSSTIRAMMMNGCPSAFERCNGRACREARQRRPSWSGSVGCSRPRPRPRSPGPIPPRALACVRGLPPRALIRRRAGVVYGVIATVGLLLALGYFALERLERSKPLAPGAASIAVPPLTNESGEASQQYFSDGISEDLITALGQFPGLKVIGRSSAFQFRDSKKDSRSRPFGTTITPPNRRIRADACSERTTRGPPANGRLSTSRA